MPGIMSGTDGILCVQPGRAHDSLALACSDLVALLRFGRSLRQSLLQSN